MGGAILLESTPGTGTTFMVHCHVVVVADGRQALEALAADRFDLVFMDCLMPTMSGDEATRAIRAGETPGGPRHTVVAMTANASTEDRHQCLAPGMDDHVANAIQLDKLQSVMDRSSP